MQTASERVPSGEANGGGPLLYVLALPSGPDQDTEESGGRPASPPVRALASVGNQTYQTILPASQPAKSCEDCLEREADTRAPAASKQAVLTSERGGRNGGGTRPDPSYSAPN